MYVLKNITVQILHFAAVDILIAAVFLPNKIFFKVISKLLFEPIKTKYILNPKHKILYSFRACALKNAAVLKIFAEEVLQTHHKEATHNVSYMYSSKKCKK